MHCVTEEELFQVSCSTNWTGQSVVTFFHPAELYSHLTSEQLEFRLHQTCALQRLVRQFSLGEHKMYPTFLFCLPRTPVSYYKQPLRKAHSQLPADS